MDFFLLWKGRVDSTGGGGPLNYDLPVMAKGRRVKVVQVMIKVLQSSGTEGRLKAELHQGPDGTVWVLHSTPIASSAVPALAPGLLAGDADTSKIIGEYTQLRLEMNSNDANPQWALVEVYVLRKPF